MEKKIKRALVISGGGSKGSFAGGLVKKMHEKGYKWNAFYGTSTGALLNTLISINDFNTLENMYTTSTNKTIFNKPPFNQNGKINIFRALWRIITGKKSIGVANNLYSLIKKTFSEKQNLITINDGKSICACVVNYTLGKAEFKYNTEESYEDFIKYTYASASVPIAMNVVSINGYEYLDGGVMEHVPLQQAINDGADEIDVIVLRPNYSEINAVWKSKNVLNVAMRSFQLMMKEISEADLIIGKLKNELNKDVKINIFYVPHDLKGNSLVFDPKTMKNWWDSGYRVDIPVYSESHEKNGLHVSEYRITVIDQK
jgi:predicted patatin/cPLA2 family phospholipase